MRFLSSKRACFFYIMPPFRAALIDKAGVS